MVNRIGSTPPPQQNIQLKRSSNPSFGMLKTNDPEIGEALNIIWKMQLDPKAAHYVGTLNTQDLCTISNARITQPQAKALVARYPNRYLTDEDARQVRCNEGDSQDIFNLLEQRAKNATEITKRMGLQIKALKEPIRNAYNNNKPTEELFNALSGIIPTKAL